MSNLARRCRALRSSALLNGLPVLWDPLNAVVGVVPIVMPVVLPLRPNASCRAQLLVSTHVLSAVTAGDRLPLTVTDTLSGDPVQVLRLVIHTTATILSTWIQLGTDHGDGNP